MNKVKSLSNNLLITLLSGSLVAEITLWYDSSPFSYSHYLIICQSNYANPDDFKRCMDIYFHQATTDHIGGVIFAVIFVTSLVLLLLKRL